MAFRGRNVFGTFEKRAPGARRFYLSTGGILGRLKRQWLKQPSFLSEIAASFRRLSVLTETTESETRTATQMLALSHKTIIVLVI